MLVNELRKFAQRLGTIPAQYWLEEYVLEANRLAQELHIVVKKLERGSSAYAMLNQLIKALQSPQPSELQVAEYLQKVVAIFAPQDSGAGVVEQLQKSCEALNRRVKNEKKYSSLRQKLVAELTPEQQVEYDKRLFLQEGMEYCLEFHLLIYHHLQTMQSEDKQRQFVCAEEVNIGSGNLPSLRTDFINDEVLEKFIFKILNNEIRDQLTKSYFFAKLHVINAQEEPILKVQEVFKQFIIEELKSFQVMGISRLASGFFQPYGYQPLLSDVAKQL